MDEKTDSGKWAMLESTAKELKELLRENDLPSDFPRTLQKVKKLVAVLQHHDMAVDKCVELRHAAEEFYKKRPRGKLMSEIDGDHRFMVERLRSIDIRISMMKH